MFSKSFPVLCLLAASVFDPGSVSAAELKLDWPTGWEYLPPSRAKGVWYLHARQISRAGSMQCLRLSIVKSASAATLVNSESVKDLVEQLAGTSSANVRALPGGAGYYYVSKGASGSLSHRVEAILFRDGYLMQLLLDTDDPSSTDTEKILAALAKARIN
jgi:hypothetical protein